MLFQVLKDLLLYNYKLNRYTNNLCISTKILHDILSQDVYTLIRTIDII